MKTFIFGIAIFLFSVILLTECQPVPSEKTFQEKAQEAYETMKQKTQELIESVQESANRALESARVKWQEFMNSTSVPSGEKGDGGNQSLMDFGKSLVANFMGATSTISPPVELPTKN